LASISQYIFINEKPYADGTDSMLSVWNQFVHKNQAYQLISLIYEPMQKFYRRESL